MSISRLTGCTAFRHGISQKIGGGSVLIRTALEDGTLRLTVRDTGVGMHIGGAVFDRGVGLRNVRDRLVKLYGVDYAPSIRADAGEGTTVTLRIPVSLAAARTSVS